MVCVAYTPGIQFLGIDNNYMNVQLFILYVNQQLFANSFGSDANRIQHQELFELVEQANEDLVFVQLQPCGTLVTTALQSQRPKELANVATSPWLTIWPNPTASQFSLRLSGRDAVARYN